jgi:hypothetical protein
MTTRNPKPPADLPRDRFVLCTTCGAELENFCFTGNAADLDGIKRTLAQCRQEGRFTGDYCSKLFIASQVPPDIPEDDPPPK